MHVILLLKQYDKAGDGETLGTTSKKNPHRINADQLRFYPPVSIDPPGINGCGSKNYCCSGVAAGFSGMTTGMESESPGFSLARSRSGLYFTTSQIGT